VRLVGRLGHAVEAAGQAGPLGRELGRARKRKSGGGWVGLALG
jgi:hypothetical protein